MGEESDAIGSGIVAAGEACDAVQRRKGREVRRLSRKSGGLAEFLLFGGLRLPLMAPRYLPQHVDFSRLLLGRHSSKDGKLGQRRRVVVLAARLGV